jgi:hypothetical protein
LAVFTFASKHRCTAFNTTTTPLLPCPAPSVPLHQVFRALMIAYDPHVEALLARFPAYSQELAGTSCFLEPGGDLVALIPPDADVDASGAVMPGATTPFLQQLLCPGGT